MPLTPEQQRRKKQLERNILTKPTAEAYAELGQLCYYAGELENAITYFTKYLKIRPNDAAVYYNLGMLLQNTPHIEEAEKHYRKALEINPSLAEAHTNLGILLDKSERIEEAEEHHGKALEINPNNAKAHNNLGALLSKSERIEEAEEYYRKALEINPNNAKAHTNLGNLLKDTQRIEEAEEYYRKALEINPNLAETHYNLGLLLKDTQRIEEAEKHFLEAAKWAPNMTAEHRQEQWVVYFVLTNIYQGQGKLEEMEKYYNMCKDANPNIADEDFEKQHHIQRPKEELYIKHLGSIGELRIDLRRLTVFIGKSGAGKSTIAKLLSILGELKLFWDGNKTTDMLNAEWQRQLQHYGILSYLHSDTYFRWSYLDAYFEYQNGQLTAGSAIHFKRPIAYMPAERMFISMAGDSLFSLLSNDIPISRYVIKFGSLFENARKHFPTCDVPILNLQYRFENGRNYIQPNSSGQNILLNESASSHQALVPMYLNMAYLREQNEQSLWVVEEPELNLFPTAQKELVDYIVSKGLFQRPSNQIIITTHSPYILASLNNLLHAYNTFLSQPKAVDAIQEIVPFEKWLDYNNVSVYYLAEGSAQNIMHPENHLILAEAIDNVSEAIDELFNQLLDIKYPSDEQE